MKRAVIAATALLLAIVTCVSAFAFPSISTSPDNNDWMVGETVNLLKSKNSGNDVNVADVACVIDEKTNEVYYRFSIVTSSDAQDCTDFAVEINLDGISETINLGYEDFNLVGETNISNPDYHVKYILYSGTSSNFFCKLKVRYNNGIGIKTGGNIQIRDKSGKSSNVLYFSFDVPNHTTETGKEDDTSKTAKETTTKRRRVTRETTTRKPISTSRVSTTKRETTTRKPTTTEKVTTAKSTTVKTTKVKTTRAKRTASETVKAADTSVVTSIVYVVPETVLSGTVYVTEETEGETEKSAFGIKDMQKSTLMKIIAGSAALVLFGAIGVAAVKSKKDDGPDDKGNKKDEE